MRHPLNRDLMCSSAVRQAHALVENVLQEGDLTIDATCGNGFDSLFLADLVGDRGHVYAFDVQDDAIRTTSERIAQAGMSSRVTLIHASHARMEDHIPKDALGRIRVVMFNLGYLPGGDKSVATSPDESIPALKTGASILAPEGIIVVVVYTGHDGGADEAARVEAALAELDFRKFDVRTIRQINRRGNPPYVIVVYRIG